MESAVIVAHFHGVIDLDFVEVRGLVSCHAVLPNRAALHAHHRSPSCSLQHFHDPCRIKALLPHTWRACRELELQAEYLLLAAVPADLEVFKVRRWLQQSDDRLK